MRPVFYRRIGTYGWVRVARGDTVCGTVAEFDFVRHNIPLWDFSDHRPLGSNFGIRLIKAVACAKLG